MFKKIINWIFVCLFVLIGTMSVSAYKESSSTRLSPAFKLNTWVNGTKEVLTSSLSTPMCKNAHFTTSNYTSLPTSYVSNSDRILTIRLMDEDPIWNADDILKTYEGGFNGRKFVGFYLDRIVTTDDSIDAANESTVELYISGFLGKLSGDATQSSGVNLFNYQVHVD